MPQNKHLKLLLVLVYILLGVLAFWVVLRYLLPWFMPFLLAFATAALLEPAVRFLIRKFRFRRWFAAGTCAVLVFVILLALLICAAGRAAGELTSFIADLPAMLSGAGDVFASIGRQLDRFVSAFPPEISGFLAQALQSLASGAAELLPALSGRLLSLASALVAMMPKIFLFIGTYAIGVFFISAGFREVKAFILRQIPESLHQKARDIKATIFSTLLKWLRAQLMLMTITFFELCAALLLLRIPYAALLALIIALIDALPVLGVGTVLIPWSFLALLSGDTAMGIALMIVYCLIAIVRSFLEPKLIGGQLGLHPVATMISIYIGFCCAGIVGMILFPIALILLKQLNDNGYLKLWN